MQITDTQVYCACGFTNSTFLITYSNRLAVWHFCFLLSLKFIATLEDDYVTTENKTVSGWKCSLFTIFVLNTPCIGKSLSSRLLVYFTGISPLRVSLRATYGSIIIIPTVIAISGATQY